MSPPASTTWSETADLRTLAELDEVRAITAVKTGGGGLVPAGSEGTIVAVWGGGAAFEVEFDQGLATVEAAALTHATQR